ncbi:uncharacterized protein BDR25DRAFT_319941 [Lindgomyces ingoldianus]|uniref:Uncharacterized protein n=1 Tax=Lindgomyces ingoldianus TaxID=673940 RepID=A0ACB6QB90_9PLEO|nr:uncharacterized protein BDR25DRAFT_319941 [Lindgomyces ingoldianus]KAF2463416.1 hypothetical protein BDR25DRAFT_319941 [Lindgomyces ingoldianus]
MFSADITWTPMADDVRRIAGPKDRDRASLKSSDSQSTKRGKFWPFSRQLKRTSKSEYLQPESTQPGLNITGSQENKGPAYPYPHSKANNSHPVELYGDRQEYLENRTDFSSPSRWHPYALSEPVFELPASVTVPSPPTRTSGQHGGLPKYPAPRHEDHFRNQDIARQSRCSSDENESPALENHQ